MGTEAGHCKTGGVGAGSLVYSLNEPVNDTVKQYYDCRIDQWYTDTCFAAIQAPT